MKITGAALLKLLGAVSAIVGIAGGTWALVEKTRPEPPAASVQFVLDTSADMQKPLGNGTTKLAAARRAILREVRQRPNLAYSLRLVGGVCGESTGEPIVELKRRGEDDNADVFRDALRGIGASGKSNFANGIARATSDLVDVDSKSKSVVAFVGGVDSCSQNAAEIIENALGTLGGESIAVQVRLLALDVPPPERQALRTLTRRLQTTMTASVSPVLSEAGMDIALNAELDRVETETTPTDTVEVPTDTGQTGTTPTDTGEAPTETGGTETTPAETSAAVGAVSAADAVWTYWLRWMP
jgi:hypothetical protein